MSSKEVKIEIQKLLDNVPENILAEILDLLKAINNKPDEGRVFPTGLKNIKRRRGFTQKARPMIDINDAIKIQAILIERFGGTKGIRDIGLLESALNRALSTFDGHDLYTTVAEKAAVTIESLVNNHPFVDGNKRIGYVIMRLILLNNGFDIIATEEEKYRFVIRIAKGEFRLEEINNWIESKAKALDL